MRKNIKILSLVLSICLVLGLLAGCGSTSTGTESTASASSSAPAAAAAPAAQEGPKTVTYASTSDIASLDPRNGTSTISASIMADLYSTLLKTDADGNIVCDAAASYDRVDDVTWHFMLREDVYFTNGVQMTSADVKYMFDSLKNKEAGYKLSGDFSFISCEVIGDFEFNLITDYPFNGLPLRLNYVKILPSAYLEEVGDEGFIAAPIGSGPFKFVSWEKDNKVVLEKNEGYYGDVPQIDQLIYKVIPEAADRVAALEAGEVDIICTVPTTQAAYLNGKDGITVVAKPSTRVVYLQFNTLVESPLQNKLVRQAMNYAVDRDLIIAGVLDGYATKVASLSTTTYQDYDPNVAGYEYNPEKAKELLTEAGYPNGFDIELSVTPGLLNSTDVVQAIAAQLGEIGVNVTILQEDSTTQREKLMNGTVSPMFLNGLGGPYANIDMVADIGFRYGARYCTWESVPEFYTLYQIGVSAVDEAERAKGHSDLQALMVDEAPAIWLYQQSTIYAYNSAKLQGWDARADEVVQVTGVTVG